ncbi:MAG: phosphoribosylformylglycinamidine cyclo-ligase [candidate division Zixibacteria bacterium]|nr:phosphoribosylformylglycinamidine cyclo-ligase [candidate division Zixibacteria bacterium]
MPPKLTYASAGVDLRAGDEAVAKIGDLARSTYTDAVLAGVGPFSGLLRLDLAEYREPVLVSSCDGVGTKLKLAIRWGHHQTIGADLVNHCVNDILTCGARPLTFLDYLALGRLDPEVVAEVVSGIAGACRDNGVALIGGETAEMPGLYKLGDYDLAGFITGLVEREAIVDGSHLAPGQTLIGLVSSGPHTNGYSLVRKILFDLNQFELDDRPDSLSGTLGDAIMAVHRSYLSPVRRLLDANVVLGMAHITGGGLAGNLIRILPEGVQAVIDTGRWPRPPVFPFLQQAGGVDPEEMFKVFNMGIGFIIVVAEDNLTRTLGLLRECGEEGFVIGNLVAGSRLVRLNHPH